MIVLVNVLSMFLCNKCPNAFLSSNQTSEEEEDNSSYTLTFNVEFQNDNDTVYFAHSYPYTYSDLQVRIWPQKDAEQLTHITRLQRKLINIICYQETLRTRVVGYGDFSEPLSRLLLECFGDV